MASVELSGDMITIGGVKSEKKLENIFQSSPNGQINSAIGNNLYGINHRQMPNAVPINKDHYGLTFFTRPELNLSSENIRNVRIFSSLLTQDNSSLAAIIRHTLDHNLNKKSAYSCPLVDPLQAFIPYLTNNLMSLSGWPDVVAPVYVAPEGVYKETYFIVDGITEIFSGYTLNATFRNIIGDPITALFLTWLHYTSRVFRGDIIPYPEKIIENEIDYQTRIYRLTLDVNRNKIQKIAACGASAPTAISIGAAFNFEADKPLNDSNDQISVPFQAVGAIYQDDILIDQFNKTVIYFNLAMSDRYRNSTYKLIPTELAIMFNNRGYPRINPNTYELEWWVDKQTYGEITSTLSQSNK